MKIIIIFHWSQIESKTTAVENDNENAAVGDRVIYYVIILP